MFWVLIQHSLTDRNTAVLCVNVKPLNNNPDDRVDVTPRQHQCIDYVNQLVTNQDSRHSMVISNGRFSGTDSQNVVYIKRSWTYGVVKVHRNDVLMLEVLRGV